MPETIPDSSGSSIATPMAPLLFTPLLLIEISVAPEFTRFGVLGMRAAVRMYRDSRVKSDVFEVCTLSGGTSAVQEWIEGVESFPKHPGSPPDSSNSASYEQNGAKVAYATRSM